MHESIPISDRHTLHNAVSYFQETENPSVSPALDRLTIFFHDELLPPYDRVASIEVPSDAVEIAQSLVENARDQESSCPRCWNTQWEPTIDEPRLVPIPDASLMVQPEGKCVAFLAIDPTTAIPCIGVHQKGRDVRYFGFRLVGEPMAPPVKNESAPRPHGTVFIYHPPLMTAEESERYRASAGHS